MSLLYSFASIHLILTTKVQSKKRIYSTSDTTNTSVHIKNAFRAMNDRENETRGLTREPVSHGDYFHTNHSTDASESVHSEQHEDFMTRGVDYRRHDLIDIFRTLSACDGTFWEITAKSKALVLEMLSYLAVKVGTLWFMPDALLSQQFFADTDIADNSQFIQNGAIFCCALFLGNNVGRWWAMNENGVSPIMNCNACCAMLLKLSWNDLVLSTDYKDDARFQLKMLRHIQRISRFFEGAVVLLFQNEPRQKGFSWAHYEKEGLFSAEEIAELQAQASLMPESVFTWIAEEIAQMSREGFFVDKRTEVSKMRLMTSQLFSARNASGCIATFLGAYLPFLYRHFSHFLVKLSNLLLCVSSSGATGDWVADILDVVIVMIAVMTFNTILIVSHHLQDPFSNNFCAFPGVRWRQAVAREFETQMRMNLAEEAKRLERAAEEQPLRESFEHHHTDDDEDDDEDFDDDDDMMDEMMDVY